MLTMKKPIKHLFARLTTLFRRKKMESDNDEKSPDLDDDMPNVRRGGISVAGLGDKEKDPEELEKMLKLIFKKRREHHQNDEG